MLLLGASINTDLSISEFNGTYIKGLLVKPNSKIKEYY